MKLRQKPKGRPGVDENVLRLAVYWGSQTELTRMEQCARIYEMSQFFPVPLSQVPVPFTLRRWLDLASERGVTLEEGKRLFQSMQEEGI